MNAHWPVPIAACHKVETAKAALGSLSDAARQVWVVAVSNAAAAGPAGFDRTVAVCTMQVPPSGRGQ
jgi:hypothetical protein